MEESKPQGTKQSRSKGGHRTRAERTQLLSAYRASGLTQEQFAARAGIKIGTLRAWIYRPQARAAVERGHFAPVRIVEAAPAVAKSSGTITVRWPQGMAVEIAVPLDESGVGRLVRELVAPCLR